MLSPPLPVDSVVLDGEAILLRPDNSDRAMDHTDPVGLNGSPTNDGCGAC
jgi:hypothetical protein